MPAVFIHLCVILPWILSLLCITVVISTLCVSLYQPLFHKTITHSISGAPYKTTTVWKNRHDRKKYRQERSNLDSCRKKKNSEKTVKLLRSRYKKITSWGKKYIGLMNMQESSIHINLYTNKSRCFSFFGKATSILLAIPCPDYCQTC